jgi:putative ubiquitin-RnfH superfamily antitoxin RatB of RatAB toxin-antitoxin module
VKACAITIEVVIASPGRQTLSRLELPPGSTVGDALSASGLAPVSAGGRFGIYGKVVPLKTVLKDGDRVEIYRPLLADPKDLRRSRAAKKRVKR